MEAVLLDTNIVSYLLKIDTRAALYRKHLDQKLLCISHATLTELYRWPIVRSWGQANTDRLKQSLKTYTLVALDEQTCEHWAQVVSIRGHPVSYHDAWIAAAALRHGLPLVTHNRKDFKFIPKLNLISEA
ncbi:MAG TPA: PIN domain-containing protein [Tepidisphaeraceae bacterium]|jgi:predicted nucleic acid-binding protein|nr:PIN domain-containing protein [Tepidisphaeraceae bacterium]